MFTVVFAATILAVEYAAAAAASATVISALLALVAAVSAWKVRASKTGVDAIRVTQDSLIGTIRELELSNRRKDDEIAVLRERLDAAESLLDECRNALKIRRRTG
jgi:hypothetical protein